MCCVTLCYVTSCLSCRVVGENKTEKQRNKERKKERKKVRLISCSSSFFVFFILLFFNVSLFFPFCTIAVQIALCYLLC